MKYRYVSGPRFSDQEVSLAIQLMHRDLERRRVVLVQQLADENNERCLGFFDAKDKRGVVIGANLTRLLEAALDRQGIALDGAELPAATEIVGALLKERPELWSEISEYDL